jgi:hypothetical protein
MSRAVEHLVTSPGRDRFGRKLQMGGFLTPGQKCPFLDFSFLPEFVARPDFTIGWSTEQADKRFHEI